MRSIEYWFWARNKRIRAGQDPDAFSPAAKRARAMATTSASPREDQAAQAIRAVQADPDDVSRWMGSSSAGGSGPAGVGAAAAAEQEDGSPEPMVAQPLAAGSDSLLSSGTSPQQLQDLLGGGAYVPLSLPSSLPSLLCPPRPLLDGWLTAWVCLCVGLQIGVSECRDTG